MRPMLTAVVVALVLLTAAFLLAPLNAGKGMQTPEAASSGLQTAAAPTYQVDATLGANPILPGYQDTVYYQVLNNSNHAPVVGLSYVTIDGTYYNHALTLLNIPGTPVKLSAAATGSWLFKLPVNASDTLGHSAVFTVWANSSALAENNSAALALSVGHLAFAVDSVCDEVTGACGTLVTGDPALVTAQAYVDSFGGDVPAANETLNINYYSTGSAPVTGVGVPLTLTTDYQGYARETFTPVATIFNVPGPDHTELELVDSVNTSVSVFVNVTWTLHNPTGTANFAFSLDSSQYYGGDKVTAAWQWRGTNATVGTLTIDNWYAFDTNTGAVIASGTLDSTAATGSFSFNLPATFYGPFDVELFAYNATDFWTLSAAASASAPTISVNPSEVYYNPGNTITVNLVTEGSIFSSATISAIVTASNSGETLYTGTVTGDSFSFTIPSSAPAPSYHILVWASTTTAGTFASATGTLDESLGFEFWAGVGTAPSYSDGSYQPGQTVQISYKLTTLGITALPAHIELEIFPGIQGAASPALKFWESVSPSGSVSFTIPSGTPNGVQTYAVEADAPSGVYEQIVSMNINSAPSALNYELGAGSGLTVGWLILLVLIVVVVLAIVAMGRRGRGAPMVMSHSSAPEWKEPQSSTPPSGGNPPSGGSTDGPASPPGSQ